MCNRQLSAHFAHWWLHEKPAKGTTQDHTATRRLPDHAATCSNKLTALMHSLVRGCEGGSCVHLGNPGLLADVLHLDAPLGITLHHAPDQALHVRRRRRTAAARGSRQLAMTGLMHACRAAEYSAMSHQGVRHLFFGRLWRSPDQPARAWFACFSFHAAVSLVLCAWGPPKTPRPPESGQV